MTCRGNSQDRGAPAGSAHLVVVAKLVLGLAVRGLVVPEPHPDFLNLTRELPAGTRAAVWQAATTRWRVTCHARHMVRLPTDTTAEKKFAKCPAEARCSGTFQACTVCPVAPACTQTLRTAQPGVTGQALLRLARPPPLAGSAGRAYSAAATPQGSGCSPTPGTCCFQCIAQAGRTWLHMWNAVLLVREAVGDKRFSRLRGLQVMSN